MGQFTIRRLMLGIGVVAGLLATYRSFGPRLAIVATLTLSITALTWLVLRRRPRLAAWAFFTSGLLGNVVVALPCIYFYSIGGIILMFFGSVPTVPLILSSGSAWALSRRPFRRRSTFVTLPLVLIFGAMPLLTMSTLWPLRVAFALSQNAMNRLADRVASGETLAAPESAGLYEIVATLRDPRSGNVALIIDADPAGKSAFVRLKQLPEAFGPMTNLNFDEHLGTLWRYQNED